MRSVETRGRTVEEAVARALEMLAMGEGDVEVEILESGRSGFLGLGSREAAVRVTVKETRPERAERFLRAVLAAMQVDLEVQCRETEEALYIDMMGREAGLLIGHHGQTLDSLQFLTNVAAAKAGDGPRIVIDVEGYRRRRSDALTRLARRLAERVRRTGERLVLEPMNAQERRVVHLALAEDADVMTSSEGEEPNRRVVIAPRG